jgi:hypothetical protein
MDLRRAELVCLIFGGSSFSNQLINISLQNKTYAKLS